MTLIKVEVRYGYTGEDSTLLRKYLAAGDTADKFGATDLGPFGDVTSDPSVVSVNEWIAGYITALEYVCAPGVNVFSASAVHIGDGPGRLVLGSKTYNVTGFAPKAGALPDCGPRGKKHIGARMHIGATGKTGWLRWHYIGGHIIAKATELTPASIHAQFAHSFNAIRNGISGIGGFYVLTNSVGITPVYTPEDVAGGVLMQGIRNG